MLAMEWIKRRLHKELLVQFVELNSDVLCASEQILLVCDSPLYAFGYALVLCKLHLVHSLPVMLYFCPKTESGG